MTPQQKVFSILLAYQAGVIDSNRASELIDEIAKEKVNV
jgi:hypothetical protein